MYEGANERGNERANEWFNEWMKACTSEALKLKCLHFFQNARICLYAQSVWACAFSIIWYLMEQINDGDHMAKVNRSSAVAHHQTPADRWYVFLKLKAMYMKRQEFKASETGIMNVRLSQTALNPINSWFVMLRWTAFPADTICWTNVALMLCQRWRRMYYVSNASIGGECSGSVSSATGYNIFW